MVVVLMVAEKPSLARSLAEILSHKRCRRRKSLSNACDVYEFESQFPPTREPAKFKMTSVCGHVMSLDFTSHYNKWDSVDPIELYDGETLKKEALPKLRICDFLDSEGRGVDHLVLWLDCDKEGENICFEVINEVQPVMKQPRHFNTQTIFRARFSSITEGSIVKAFNSLSTPNQNEARSVDARQELDLRIGCSFTRFQTRTFQTKYAGLNHSVISYGPCQTPTLGFCVQRHDEIQQFTPEKYWRVDVKVKLRSVQLDLDWERERVFDKEVCSLFLKLVKDHQETKVVEATEKLRTKSPPMALHTVELLRSASSRLHMGPKQAMDVAERLYTEGYISYPRTETTSYPSDFEFRSILTELSKSPDFGEYASELLRNKFRIPSSGKDVGDHPPITPMLVATRDSLRDAEWKVYDFVTRHFLATLSPDCKYKVTEVQFLVGAERFQWVGQTPVSPGFTAVYTWQAMKGFDSPVVFEKGQVWEVVQVKLSEHETSPPGYLTESELISLMEKHGIGTDASIPVHIENICLRDYARVDSGRKLVPTKLGVVLVHGYQKIDPDLVLPTMRSSVEEQLNLIAKGNADYDGVLSHTLDVFKRKFEYFRENVEGMDELFEASFSSVAESGRPISRCGKCRRFMKYIAARPQRLYCMHCDETFSLPQGGSIKLFKELKCPLDEFELLLFSGTSGKSFLVCPLCYNQPPFQNVRTGMGCHLCPHEACPHAKPQQRVEKCQQCEHGILVLEPRLKTAGPTPKWRVTCNDTRCKVAMNCFEGSSDVQSTRGVCPDCGANLLSVDLTKVHNLPDGAPSGKVTGCWNCDPVLSELVLPVDHAAERYRGRGGRGRGRRRGRGRGRW